MSKNKNKMNKAVNNTAVAPTKTTETIAKEATTTVKREPLTSKFIDKKSGLDLVLHYIVAGMNGKYHGKNAGNNDLDGQVMDLMLNNGLTTFTTKEGNTFDISKNGDIVIHNSTDLIANIKDIVKLSIDESDILVQQKKDLKDLKKTVKAKTETLVDSLKGLKTINVDFQTTLTTLKSVKADPKTIKDFEGKVELSSKEIQKVEAEIKAITDKLEA
jgi:hypothetical protein